MRILIVCVSLFYYSADCLSQINWVEDWNKSTLEMATAKGTLKMNSVEKEVVFYCNLVRISPKKFLQTIVPKYVSSRKLNNSSYLISLQRDLKRAKKLPPLTANNDLYEVAKVHAVSSGKKGTIGHQNYTKRFKHLNDVFSVDGENCDYGNSEAIDIVFSWLIDEGIANLGHRKNILDPEFSHTGVSIAPHKTYEVNAVMTYGMK